MGVENLMKVIKEHAGDAIQSKKWSAFSNKTVAIDVSTLVYKYAKGWYGVPNQPKKNDITMVHVHGFLQLLDHLAKFQIKPM